MKKHTKIVCTIGPASETKTVLSQMIKAGMNVARLNFSHGSYANHRLLIRNIRAVAKKLGRNVAIMQDLQGPRIRIGQVPKEGIKLTVGDRVVFQSEKSSGCFAEKNIPVDYKQFSKLVKLKDSILINDGLIEVAADRISKEEVYGTVKKPGIIFSHKGINLPGSAVTAEVITKKDKQDLQFGLKCGVDFVALSFVRSAADIIALRKLIGVCDVQIIAKIERQEAVKNFSSILTVTDGVMVARGDLGIEMKPSDVPLVQKDLIFRCLQVGKPVIVATQMLESMIINPRPTRAEVSDVANAVIDHTDAVMLSGESAFGKYPVESVAMMSQIICDTEASRYDDVPARYIAIKNPKIEDAISFAAYDLSKQAGVKAVVVNSYYGHAARIIARHRLEIPIFVLTNNIPTQNKMALSWGIESLFLPKCRSFDEFLNKAVILLKKQKVVKKGDKIVLVIGHPVDQSSGANLVKVHVVA